MSFWDMMKIQFVWFDNQLMISWLKYINAVEDEPLNDCLIVFAAGFLFLFFGYSLRGIEFVSWGLYIVGTITFGVALVPLYKWYLYGMGRSRKEHKPIEGEVGKK